MSNEKIANLTAVPSIPPGIVENYNPDPEADVEEDDADDTGEWADHDDDEEDENWDDDDVIALGPAS